MIGLVLFAFAVLLAVYSIWLAVKGERTPDYLGWMIAAIYKAGDAVLVLAIFAFLALIIIKIIAP